MIDQGRTAHFMVIIDLFSLFVFSLCIRGHESVSIILILLQKQAWMIQVGGLLNKFSSADFD